MFDYNIYTFFYSPQDLEFHGVMRFYFQDSGQKVATKCIRVASDATSQAVIETLIEKFRPDMRMLSVPEYALYEIHENGGNSIELINYLLQRYSVQYCSFIKYTRKKRFL